MQHAVRASHVELFLFDGFDVVMSFSPSETRMRR